MNEPATKNSSSPATRDLRIECPVDLLPELDAARDELERELNVRTRCFPRWVTEGRLSSTDARDRLDRHGVALQVLRLITASAVSPVLVTK